MQVPAVFVSVAIDKPATVANVNYVAAMTSSYKWRIMVLLSFVLKLTVLSEK